MSHAAVCKPMDTNLLRVALMFSDEASVGLGAAREAGVLLFDIACAVTLCRSSYTPA